MNPTLLDQGKTDLSPIYIKHVECPELDSPFHFHPYCELVHIVKGSGRRVVGDSVENYSTGDLVLIGPNLPHIWHSDPTASNEHTIAVVVYFSPSYFDQIVDQKTLTQIRSLLLSTTRGLKFYGTLSKWLAAQMLELLSLQGLDLTLRFVSIIQRLMENHQYTPITSIGYQNFFSEKSAMRIEKVYKYIMDNFKRTITLEEISAYASLTPNSFCRFFKQSTQKPFSLFVNEMRISYACRLLANRQLSINQISCEAGFLSITNFNRFFKEITGTTPTEYRRRVTCVPCEN